MTFESLTAETHPDCVFPPFLGVACLLSGGLKNTWGKSNEDSHGAEGMGILDISLVRKRPSVLGMVPCRRGLLKQRSFPHAGNARQ